ACFWATSLEEIIGGVIPIISFRPGGWNSCDSRMTRLPARELPAPYEVAREVLAGRRKLGRDLGPVAFQLLGDELGETRHRALPHRGAGDADGDAVIRRIFAMLRATALELHVGREPGLELAHCKPSALVGQNELIA